MERDKTPGSQENFTAAYNSDERHIIKHACRTAITRGLQIGLIMFNGLSVEDDSLRTLIRTFETANDDTLVPLHFQNAVVIQECLDEYAKFRAGTNSHGAETSKAMATVFNENFEDWAAQRANELVVGVIPDNLEELS